MDYHEMTRAMKFFTVMEKLHRAWGKRTPCENLSKAQFGTLMMLKGHDKPPFSGKHRDGCNQKNPEKIITVGMMASKMGQSMPAISKRINTLEEMGYVKRMADLADRRMTRVLLTEEGETLLEQTHLQWNKNLEKALQTMGEEKTERLFALMEELIGAIENVE